MREYSWCYVPRRKYRLPPWNETDCEEVFQVSLCDDCSSVAANCAIRGWDWWDAYDCIGYAIDDLKEVEQDIP